MSNIYFYLLLALVAGAMMPTQAATNNKMAVLLNESPILAAFISFFVGTVALFAYALVSGANLSDLALSRNAPPVAWVGGLLGAFFVTATVSLVPRLGVALTFSLIIAGQMIVTLVIDHFGLLGVPMKEISLARVGGILLITTGVILIRKF